MKEKNVRKQVEVDIPSEDYITRLIAEMGFHQNLFARRMIKWAIYSGAVTLKCQMGNDAFAIGHDYDRLCDIYRKFLSQDIIHRIPELGFVTLAMPDSPHYQIGFATLTDANGDFVASFKHHDCSDLFLLALSPDTKTQVVLGDH